MGVVESDVAAINNVDADELVSAFGPHLVQNTMAKRYVKLSFARKTAKALDALCKNALFLEGTLQEPGLHWQVKRSAAKCVDLQFRGSRESC